MRVSGGWPLSRKILCLALLNLSLLGVALFAFARSQFQLGAESLLLGSARDRIVGIADSFTLGLTNLPENARDSMFESYAARYGADVFLTDPRGVAFLGPQITLSPELMNQINRSAPPPRKRPPPPKKERPARKGEDDSTPPPAEDDSNGPPPAVKGDAPPPKGRPSSPPDAAFLVITHNPTRYWAGARVPVKLPEWDSQRPALFLLRSSSMFNSNLFFDWRLWTAVALTVIAVTALCWIPFVRGITRSVGEMDRVTRQISEGRFGAHGATMSSAARSDELGHLAAQINRMAARLEGFVKNQKRFLGDIAHELCAPIARIQFALGILERKAAAGESDMTPHVNALYEEIQEMSSLVNELLSFSKAGMNPEAAALEAVDLESIVTRVIAREAFAGAPVESTVPAGLRIMANEAFLLRAVSNVVRNAVRYAGSAGPIGIRAERQGDTVTLIVADSGPGLPEAELEEVFAPFYRPEAARTRETGGAGLGLAIVKSCVEACRGTVECRNRSPRGLEVVFRLAASL
jgi:two-component system sensor histidine kinase CpxA